MDFWLRLLEAAAPHRIDWRWVRGHAGDVMNERADAWRPRHGRHCAARHLWRERGWAGGRRGPRPEQEGTLTDAMEADYVVVGAGSAGCVIAARLSETGAQVLLLEAGPKDWLLWIHIPAGVLKLLYHPVVNWNYSAEPAPGSAGRRIHWPRGKTLGGSSSINGMLYVRGNPADFDGWAQMGCRGWSFDDVLPYFRMSEDYKQGADPEYRGKGGPLRVEDYRTILPLTHRFIEAARQAGYSFSKDLNGRQQEGVGYSQMTRKGRWRGSTARTFLKEAQGRPNLRVETEALATKLLFEGKRCVGVAFNQRGRDDRGSGRAGSDPVRRCDQLAAPVADFRGRAGGTSAIDRRAGGARSARCGCQSTGSLRRAHFSPGARVDLDQQACARVSAGAGGGAFRREGRGALTFGVTSAQVFCRSSPEKASPDLQLLFTPASYDAAKFGELEREDGMTVAVCPVRPDSRGTSWRAVRTRRSPRHYAELSFRSGRRAGAARRHAFRARNLRVACDRNVQHSGDAAGAGHYDRRRVAGLCAALRHDHLPSCRDLPYGGWSLRRGGFAAARAWHRRTAE